MGDRWVELAEQLGQIQPLNRAIEAYQQALALDPNSYRAWLGLGHCCSKLDRWQDSIAAYQQALAVNPNAVEAHYYLGLSLVEAGQTQGAIAAFDRAMVLNSAVANLIASTLAQLQTLGKLTPTDSAVISAAICPMDAPQTAVISSIPSDAIAYLPIRSDTAIALTPPLTCDQRVHSSFWFGSEIRLPETFVAGITDGRFWLDPDQSSLAIMTGHNQLLVDLSVEFPILSPGSSDRPHWLFVAKKIPPPQVVEGSVVVLAGLSNHVYFHWMGDVLPRIELLQLAGIEWGNVDGIVVSHRRSFQMETLAILGVPQEKILQTDEHLHLQATQLIVPSFSGSAAWMSREACEFLRKTFLNQIPLAERGVAQPAERIYISRQSANRCVINELEVTRLLKPLGFQTIVLETLSVVEQVALFANARVIVAPHGSGLTNLVFCHPDATVIELFSPHYVYPCYWYLANLVNVTYYYLLGVLPLGASFHKLLYPNPRIEDIFIDLDALVDILKLAGVIDD
ncbi:MAG: DUF563 domain-containing protein [Leptolyngbyaceae cyanobacterium SL_7_1]|nr:DUF563 domain-containing protein [Leptolyngbyaceae cyanobacterium SL_7_1]